jgi:hypothetical protein
MFQPRVITDSLLGLTRDHSSKNLEAFEPSAKAEMSNKVFDLDMWYSHGDNVGYDAVFTSISEEYTAYVSGHPKYYPSTGYTQDVSFMSVKYTTE